MEDMSFWTTEFYSDTGVGVRFLRGRPGTGLFDVYGRISVAGFSVFRLSGLHVC